MRVTPMTTRCVAVKDDGERCAVDFGINPENSLCFAHDPDRRKRAHRARSRGGRTTGEMNRARYTRTVPHPDAMEPPTSAADCVAWSSWTTHAVATGVIDRGTAREINSSLKTLLVSLDKADNEARIEELREQVAALKESRA